MRLLVILLAALIAAAGCTDLADKARPSSGPTLLCDDGALEVTMQPEHGLKHNVEVFLEADAPEAAVLGYVWIVDGESHSGPSLSTTFFEPGIHTAEARAFTEEGCVLREVLDIEAANDAPEATFSYSVEGSKVALDASGSTDPNGDSLRFEWFVDGELVGRLAQVELHVGDEPLVVTLRAIDEFGAEGEDLQRIDG